MKMPGDMLEDAPGSSLGWFSIYAESKNHLNGKFNQNSYFARFQEHSGYCHHLSRSSNIPVFCSALCFQILFISTQKHGLPTICQVGFIFKMKIKK